MKLSLTITSGSLARQKYDLESGFLTIGRGENCSVRLDPQTERIASKQHAFIEAKADGFYLTDNQSTNGTFHNGQQIQSVKLNNSDTIQFGKNGVTATVNIEGDSYATDKTQVVAAGVPPPPQQNYRDYQLNQFNQAAQSRPVNLQNSISNLGLGRIENKPEKNNTGKYVGIGVTILGVVFLSLIVILIMFASVGIGAAILASVVAFIPAMFYLLPMIWLDRYDPEPFWLLALAFAWGALVAVIVSFVVNTGVGMVVYSATGDPNVASAVGAVISAPVFEEGSKGLGLLILLIFFRRYFDDILDGIVFAGVIALGFATVENVLYYGRGILDGGSGGLILLFVLRGIMSPFAHVTFTAMTGIGCGISRESHNMAVRLIMPVLGYICAVILHAIWNGMAVLGGLGGFIIGYVILQIPFFLIFVGFSFYVMHRQNKILKEMLAIDIARGVIPKEHAEKATSAFKGSAWVLGGLFNGAFRARSNYIRAIGKLGLSYWHIQRATAAQGHTGSFQQNPILRDEVLHWRDKV
ncbi:MAG TPA: PrsW family glutamic-type intramembrane protease [Pyrinomonadaceae bacterium]|jgi:RsiW-degrading membrane proteinase PrsW (M82 family)/pSer/pThr/pTyr-binding forkhead associated (FHA) protein